MHEPLLAKAAKPAPMVCLGLLLKPYSLGHELCLIESGNPLTEFDLCPKRDLLDAVLTCSQSWQENQCMVFDPLIRLKLWIWKRRCARFSFALELARFIAYRNNGSLELPPSELPRKESGRQLGSPFLLRLNQWLVLTLRLSEDHAWDYPYGLAKIRWAAYWEEEGGLDIYNQHEAQFDRFVAQQEARGREAICRAS